ncbi:helix-turn-helix domain-containing protein [Niveispirillum sp. KHB5.9]|uniref:helix-turn-helix domain-containing protein n=1 Tax=Niveispirillum sp. KHB5.9 TaxID=3400269 RepID=UPI003A88A463
MMTKATFATDLTEALEEAIQHAKGTETGAVKHVVMVDTVDVRAIRNRLGLSRPQFAERFGLDARTVQDWEQGRRRPDKAAQSYLKVIANNPEAVVGALAG